MMAIAAGSVSGPCDAAGHSGGQGGHPTPQQTNLRVWRPRTWRKRQLRPTTSADKEKEESESALVASPAAGYRATVSEPPSSPLGR